MPNLSIQNLNRMVEGGNIEGLLGGTPALSPNELRVTQEMKSQGLEAPAAVPGKTFSDILRHSIDQVNNYQVQADTAIKELIAGRNKNIHETMLTIERADTSLKMMMQVRNKILDAYKEIMRMQV